MSQIALSPPAGGTGVFTIAAPATNTNQTLTLPDNSGTVLNENSNIEAQVKTATNATGTAPIYAARAWVNFDGSTGTIRASGNVQSVTRNGTGDYTVTFTVAMPDAKYAIAAVLTDLNNLGFTSMKLFNAPTASSFRFTSAITSNGVAQESTYASVVIYR